MRLLVSIVGIMFIVTAIQYWDNVYNQQVLGVDRTTSELYVPITCLSAPVCGVLVVGFVSYKLGGFESYGMLRVIQVIGFILMLMSISMPFYTSFAVFST